MDLLTKTNIKILATRDYEMITHFEESNLHSVFYHFRIGDFIFNDKNREMQSITLQPQESVAVISFERFNIPDNIIVSISTKSTLNLKKVVMFASAYIDPLFEGRLEVLLLNTSQNTISLNKGDILGKLYFYRFNNNDDVFHNSDADSEELLKRKKYSISDDVGKYWS
ncbi:dCTP deaminase domain-containing protein [Pseudodesulfovibrio mercurii]|uniref:dCTP deaminase domain-containing protein n=1 Tax=Pseudodesulfovibrio mercurii TaxID=641491 RepID=UPI00167F21F5|nr:hypothetical protein [Pseudodesulfovibrio mercurii]